MRARVKICCINSIMEAKIAIESGADAIGLVGKMPSGPGPLPDESIRLIAKSIPPFIGTFLLTSETSVKKIIKHYSSTQTNTIQVVDLLSKGTYAEIKYELPHVKIVQVVHVMDQRSVEMAVNLSGYVDAILLDSGNPNLKIKELGGTGRVHNWEFSRQIREYSQCPIILAGGLYPGNVKEAIETVLPFAVDVCSGVRTNNLLDQEKVSAFIKNAWSVNTL